MASDTVKPLLTSPQRSPSPNEEETGFVSVVTTTGDDSQRNSPVKPPPSALIPAAISFAFALYCSAAVAIIRWQFRSDYYSAPLLVGDNIYAHYYYPSFLLLPAVSSFVASSVMLLTVLHWYAWKFERSLTSDARVPESEKARLGRALCLMLLGLDAVYSCRLITMLDSPAYATVFLVGIGAYIALTGVYLLGQTPIAA